MSHNTEHHFIIYYSRVTKQWTLIDDTSPFMGDGSIWDREDSEWRPPAEDGEDPEEEFFQGIVEDNIQAVLNRMNSTAVFPDDHIPTENPGELK